MPSTTVKGQLEIDHDRGVVYFHASEQRVIKQYGGVTILRICRLPKPLPRQTFIDLMHADHVGFHRKGDPVKTEKSTTAKTVKSLAKQVADGWKIEVGKGRKLISDQVARAMVSAELIHVLRIHYMAETTLTGSDYLQIYEDACKILGLSELDPG